MKQSLRTFSGLFVAVASLAAVGSVQAQTSSMSNPAGGFSMYSPGSSYIGFNAGRSDFSVGRGTGAFAFDEKDDAYSLYAGSYFNSNFGAELGYTQLGKITRGGGTTKAEGINLSLVGKLPLSQSFNLLGKVGTTYGRTNVSAAAGSGIASGSESGFGLSYGVGVEYAFQPNLSAVLQYDEHKMDFVGSGRDRVSAATVGLRYRF